MDSYSGLQQIIALLTQIGSEIKKLFGLFGVFLGLNQGVEAAPG